MSKIIVLETAGKNDSVDTVKVKLFDDRHEAIKHCIEVTDKPMDKKYWRFAEIIDEGKEYETYRYENL